jgi:hypothetical protein
MCWWPVLAWVQDVHVVCAGMDDCAEPAGMSECPKHLACEVSQESEVCVHGTKAAIA